MTEKYSDWLPKPGLQEHIKQLRRDRHMTQADLAKEVRVSRTQIVNIERGNVGFTLSMIVRLARAFDMTASELLYGVDLSEYE